MKQRKSNKTRPKTIELASDLPWPMLAPLRARKAIFCDNLPAMEYSRYISPCDVTVPIKRVSK